MYSWCIAGHIYMQVTQAFGETQLIVSGATATMLAIGRFAALPYQRRIAESQVPMQNGETHLSAGDSYAPAHVFIKSSLAVRKDKCLFLCTYRCDVSGEH